MNDHQFDVIPGRTSSQACLDLLNRLWTPLAAIAWEGYCHEGPGIVFIDASQFETTGQFGRYTYVGEGSNYFRNALGGRWPHEPTARAVVDYDPQRALVCTFWWGGDNRAACFVLDCEGRLPPPLIYEAVRLRPQEFS